MKTILIITVVLSILSCGNKVQPSYESVKISYADYVYNDNYESLKTSYKRLTDNEDFKRNGIYTENAPIVIPILTKMEKYDDLLELLEKSKSIDPYLKSYYLNYTNYIKYRCANKNTSNQYITNNLILIKKQILENPNDSILYIDYYATKLHIDELANVLNEIDSISPKKFSDDFYTKMLKKSIIDMDKQIQPCN